MPANGRWDLTLRLLMSYIYIYGAPILDFSRSQTTTHHSRWDSSGRVISSSQIYIYIYIYIYIIDPNRIFLLGMSGYSLVFPCRLLCVCKLNWRPHLFITLPQECRNEWNLNARCTGYYRADFCWLFYLIFHSSCVNSNSMPHNCFF